MTKDKLDNIKIGDVISAGDGYTGTVIAYHPDWPNTKAVKIHWDKRYAEYESWEFETRLLQPNHKIVEA